MSTKTAYHSIPTFEGEQDDNVPIPRPRQRRDWRYLLTVLILLCTATSIIFLQSHHIHRLRTHWTTQAYNYDNLDFRVSSCGSTAAEALAKGCHFDPVTFAWLPERCLDRELAAELLLNTTWTVHADLEGKVPKSTEQFSRDDAPTYITNGNHVLHCVYSWRRLHRIIRKGMPYHSGLSYLHTVHCGNVVLEVVGQDPDKIYNGALVIYPVC